MTTNHPHPTLTSRPQSAADTARVPGKNRVRLGVLLILTAVGLAIGAGTAAALGSSLVTIGAFAVAAEITFWVGVLLLGYSTYKLARAKGLRRVPAELWKLFREPHGTRKSGTSNNH
jgi:uncharacterized transporter YbjL